MIETNVFKTSQTGLRPVYECVVFILLITVNIVVPYFTMCADKRYFPAKFDQHCLNQSHHLHVNTQSEEFNPGCYTCMMVSVQLVFWYKSLYCFNN